MSVTFKEEEVRERAYHLWESEGRCEGRDDHYWHLAIKLLEQQARTASPAAREGQVANSTIAAPDKSSALADAKPGIECRQQASAAGDAQKAEKPKRKAAGATVGRADGVKKKAVR